MVSPANQLIFNKLLTNRGWHVLLMTPKYVIGIVRNMCIDWNRFSKYCKTLSGACAKRNASKNLNELRSFLGMANYNCKYVPNAAQALLLKLLKKYLPRVLPHFDTHRGIVKMTALARSYTWRPKIQNWKTYEKIVLSVFNSNRLYQNQHLFLGNSKKNPGPGSTLITFSNKIKSGSPHEPNTLNAPRTTSITI